jgi:hypothetical protein
MEPIIKRENIIESVILQFHTAANPKLIPILNQEQQQDQEQGQPQEQNPPSNTYNFNLFPDNPNQKFGTLEIKIADTPMSTAHHVLDTNCDMSGSMDDNCSDGKTKMQHAKHTLKNIVTALSNTPDASVTMATYAFDDKVETVFQDTEITEDPAETTDKLRTQLDQMQPRGGTDIYQALNAQATRAKNRAQKKIRQTNITLTDGQANQGKSTSYAEMAKQVAPNCTNVFIGFGHDHNAVGLHQLADAQPNGHYFYVAEIEKAALVFGEVIHQMLYTALKNVIIQVENAEIYDYKTNTWSKELKIPSIVSEATKTYHLRSTTPDDTVVKILAQSEIHEEEQEQEQEPTLISDDNIPLPNLINAETEQIFPTDLSAHMFRQRTQELLYKAHEHSITSEIQTPTTPSREAYKEKSKTIRKDIVEFTRFMQQYATENGLENDDLINTLIADLTVIAKTFGGPRSALYTMSKSNSQGRQTSNNTNYIDPSDFATRNIFGLRRQNALDPNNNNHLNDLPSPAALQRGVTRTYTTPRQMAMMRRLTGEQNIADLDLVPNIPFPSLSLSPSPSL